MKHWNRGDVNSCARTDLTFKPVPDSPLARKREERARKAADKEREDQKVCAHFFGTSCRSDVGRCLQKMAVEKMASSIGSSLGGGSGNLSANDSAHHLNPFDRQTPRNFSAAEQTPALRQLSDFARPHGAMFAPGFPRTSLAGPMPTQPPTPGPGSLGSFPLGPPFQPHGPGMDQLLQYGMNMQQMQQM